MGTRPNHTHLYGIPTATLNKQRPIMNLSDILNGLSRQRKINSIRDRRMSRANIMHTEEWDTDSQPINLAEEILDEIQISENYIASRKKKIAEHEKEIDQTTKELVKLKEAFTQLSETEAYRQDCSDKLIERNL